MIAKSNDHQGYIDGTSQILLCARSLSGAIIKKVA